MKKFKKLLTVCLVGIMVMSMTITGYASAEKLILNNGGVEFNKLLIVEDGVTYIPLRLALNQNSNQDEPGYDPDYAINVKDFIDQNYVEVSMRRKDANGQLINEGRYIKIEWYDEVKNAEESWATGNGRITFIKYDVIDGTNQINLDNDHEIYEGLESEIKLIQLDETGDRLFLSLGDIEKIVSFMTDGSDYQVVIQIPVPVDNSRR